MKKILSVVLIVLMAISCISIGLLGLSIGNDSQKKSLGGISIEASSKQDAYDWGDVLVFSIKATNNSQNSYQNVRIRAQANKSKFFYDGESNTETIEDIKAGESKTVEVKVQSSRPNIIQRIFILPIYYIIDYLSPMAFNENRFNASLQVKVGLFKYKFGFEVTDGKNVEIENPSEPNNPDINDPSEPTEPTEPTKPTKPEDPAASDEYYWENSIEVISVINANESEAVLSESEAIALFTQRGFKDFNVTYDSTIEGEFVDDSVASKGSIEKHPMYSTYYITENGDVWSIYIIDGDVYAYPATYNLSSESEAEFILSETSKLTSYNIDTNKFYVTIPKESVVVVKVVESITAETLENYSFEGSEQQ